jgi:ferredoxin
MTSRVPIAFNVLCKVSRSCLTRAQRRSYAVSQVQLHGYDDALKNVPETLKVRWIMKDGKEITTPAPVGATLLQVAHHNGVEMEGACEGVCACSTCHVILQKNVYDSLPEPSELEEDMLDQAFGLTATSRLGCQVTLTEEIDNLVVKMPKATRNFYVVSLPNT